MTLKYYMAYLSPNGSTERVAHTLAEGLSADGISVSSTNLANREITSTLVDSMEGHSATCLFLGSPVYFNKTVPPVMEFIESLPPSQGGWAVPFVTYGKACSGVALWQMATALQDKGYRVAGAAKVLAVHSLMWNSSAPEGHGHPDKNDLEQIREFSRTLMDRLLENASQELEPAALDYQPEELSSEIKSTMGEPWPIMPKTVNPELCTECGTCADECPVDTISFDPFPVFGTSCIDCFNCVRQCPEEAIFPGTPLEKIEAMVRNRVLRINEEPPTQVFLPGQD